MPPTASRPRSSYLPRRMVPPTFVTRETPTLQAYQSRLPIRITASGEPGAYQEPIQLRAIDAGDARGFLHVAVGLREQLFEVLVLDVADPPLAYGADRLAGE